MISTKFSAQSRKLVFSLLLILPLTIKAQQPESSKAIKIVSDKSTALNLSEEGKRIFTYTGNVRLTQEKIEITGNKAEITMDLVTNQIVNALVTGDPVYFQNTTKLADANTTGQSKSIEYQVSEGLVEFVGQVSFLQPGISYQCEKLLYRIVTSLAEGTGGCQVSLDN